MKKTFFFLTFLSISALIWLNCSKVGDLQKNEDPKNEETTSRTGLNDFALTTQDVVFSNGLLAFKNQAIFDRVIKSLIDLEASASFKALFLATKGISATDPESPNYVKNAGLQAFEERFSGYVSLRRKMQDAERIFYENGGDPANFESGDIKSPFLQTVDNQFREIKIGHSIFRDIDANHTFVVLDGDFSTLTALKNLPNPFQSNLPANVLRFDNRVLEDETLANSILGGDCFGFIGVNIVANNSFKLESFVFQSLNDPATGFSVTWEIKNSLGQIIFTGTGNPKLTGVLPNASYPITVKASISGGNDCNPLTITKLIQNSTPDCTFTPDFTENPIDLGNFTFRIVQQPNCCDIFYKWSVDGGPVTTTGPNTPFNFDSGSGDSDFTVTVTMINPAGCSATQTFTVTQNCGHESSKKKPISYATNRLAIGEIWTKNTLFYRGFNSELKNFRKKSNGKWVSEDADNLSFVFKTDSKFTKKCSQYQFLSTTPYTINNHNKLRCEYQYTVTSGTKVRVRQGEVTCTYSVIEDGVSFPDVITITL